MAAPKLTAANLMHQTDASGVQQQIVTTQTSSSSTDSESGGIRKSNISGKFADTFLRLCCCFPGAADGSSGDGRAGYHISLGKSGSTMGGKRPHLLPPLAGPDLGKKCLVLDLDETLVHSSFKPIPNPDYVLPVEIEGTVHHIYVLKRPGVDQFMQRMGELYEVVIYTASVSKYADPLLDLLDVHKVIRHRLFRESCTCHEGVYVKDLARLGRELRHTIIVDNSPSSYLFQPEHAIGIGTFIDDMNDRELYYCLPFLESIVDKDNVTEWLHGYSQFIAQQALEHGRRLT